MTSRGSHPLRHPVCDSPKYQRLRRETPRFRGLWRAAVVLETDYSEQPGQNLPKVSGGDFRDNSLSERCPVSPHGSRSASGRWTSPGVRPEDSDAWLKPSRSRACCRAVDLELLPRGLHRRWPGACRHGACPCAGACRYRYPAPVPPFCAAGCAMGLDDGTVDEKQTVLTVLGKCIEDRLPDAAPSPAGVAVVDGGARTISFRRITPRCASPKDIENPVQNPGPANGRCR